MKANRAAARRIAGIASRLSALTILIGLMGGLIVPAAQADGPVGSPGTYSRLARIHRLTSPLPSASVAGSARDRVGTGAGGGQDAGLAGRWGSSADDPDQAGPPLADARDPNPLMPNGTLA